MISLWQHKHNQQIKLNFIMRIWLITNSITKRLLKFVWPTHSIPKSVAFTVLQNNVTIHNFVKCSTNANKRSKEISNPLKDTPPRPPKIRLRMWMYVQPFWGCVKFLLFFLLQIYNADGESSAGDRFTDIVCDSGLLTPQ